MEQTRRAALVYQAGLANVFEVDRIHRFPAERGNTVRIIQGTFDQCEWFARGLQRAGWTVGSLHCNEAGDIREREWSLDLFEAPFCDKQRPVGKLYPEDVMEINRQGW